MSSAKVPQTYSNDSWTSIKVATYPESSPCVTPVMVLTINRPEKYNAFTTEIENEMIHMLGLFDMDDRVKVIVVTGAGRIFCAGADLDIGLHRSEGDASKDHRDGYASTPFTPNAHVQYS
jgi:enoyl-CoA hydratase/carnithine racemase